MTIEGLPVSDELKSMLKNCQVEIQQFVLALEAEIGKLQRQVASLEVNKISQHKRIKALEGELEKYARLRRFVEDVENATPQQLEETVVALRTYITQLKTSDE